MFLKVKPKDYDQLGSLVSLASLIFVAMDHNVVRVGFKKIDNDVRATPTGELDHVYTLQPQKNSTQAKISLLVFKYNDCLQFAENTKC